MAERQLSEKVEELRNKINLLEGERKAYYEKSYYSQKKNKERIAELRNDNKDLRKQLKDRLSADDHVINQAFQDRPVERAALSNKSSSHAIQTMDFKVSDTKKRLNALHHMSDVKQQKLDELEQENNAMEQDAREAKATEAGESAEGRRLRDIENKMDKTNMKLREAEHIKRTYEHIKSHLQEEHMTFGNTLDDMEKEINQIQQEIEELKRTDQDAQESREDAQQRLRQMEDKVYSERKRRESELQKLKAEADEKRLQHEKMERRMAQREAAPDAGPERASSNVTDDQQEKINDLQEAFKRIKDVTGVSDLGLVVERFEDQGATHEKLEEQKKDAILRVRRLQEEREALRSKNDEIKFSGESKLSSGQKILEEYQNQQRKEDQEQEDVDRQLESSSKVLIECKAGIDHLHEKLAHVKVPRSQAPQAALDPSSDSFALDLLSKCEERLGKLKEELENADIEEEERNMREGEFNSKVESKLPQQNLRIRLGPGQKQNVYDESDSDAEDDGGEVLSRQAVKKQSQQLIDQKTKKRVARKKKKK